MQIPADLKAAYKAYRKNGEPVTPDFSLGDPPYWMRACLQKASDDLLTAQYNLYVAACFAKNIEPVLKDFLVGEIPDEVSSVMEHVENEVELYRKEKLLAASA
jgi:hypothetical protein